MEKLRAIADEATNGISQVLGKALSDQQQKEIERLVEAAVIKGLLEGQHRAVDAAISCPEADQDLAHKIATEIRKKNDLVIVNLSSMR
jgi:hypothetical protein